MNHAKRRVLVLGRKDTLCRYEQRQRLDTSPIMADVMHKDMDMSNTLQCRDMDDVEKQKFYHANLEPRLTASKKQSSTNRSNST